MQLSNPIKTLLSALVALAAMCVASSLALTQNQACPGDDSGLKLPAGFCATVFADGIGHARHMVVAPSGVLYVNTWSGRYYGDDTPHAGGFLVALEDNPRCGKGRCDCSALAKPSKVAEQAVRASACIKDRSTPRLNDRIVRYSLPAGSVVPNGSAETIVSGLPLGGDHPMHPFIIDAEGSMYVDVASATNACQVKNRTLKSPGADPCTELQTRGGIWRYDANNTNQVFSTAERFATGIRNAEGFAIDTSRRVFVTQHGRDQLHANWPDLYKPEEEATLPAEQLMLLKPKGDYGWPECYYDAFAKKLVLAPEYGGDGGKTIGVCANKLAPIAAFPAHWAPNAMVRYDKKQFPARYRNGVFIAFHGSWDRAPYAQGGYNVVFQPLAGDRASGQCEVFADGFAGAVEVAGQSRASSHRRWRCRRTVHSMFPTMCADGFTGLSIRAAPKQAPRTSRPVRA